MKPTANFKLSKSAKRMMASSGNKEKGNIIKNMMIQAELAASVQMKPSKRRESAGS